MWSEFIVYTTQAVKSILYSWTITDSVKRCVLNYCRDGKEGGVYFISVMENYTSSIMRMRKNLTQDVQKIPYFWKSAKRSLLTLNILNTIMFSQ